MTVITSEGTSKLDYVGKTVDDIVNFYDDKVYSNYTVKGDYSSGGASTILRQEMKDAGINPPPYSNQAHHIIPEGYDLIPEAQEARDILANCGVELNSPANGVFLPSKADLQYAGNAAVHNGGHTKEYIISVTEALKAGNPKTPEQAIAILSDLREQLLEGTLQVHKVN